MAAAKLKKMYQPNMEFVQKNRSHLSVAKFETEFISCKISRKLVGKQSYETERSPMWRGSFGVAPQLAAWKEEERKLRCGSTSSRCHLSPLRLRSSSSSQPLFAMNLASQALSLSLSLSLSLILYCFW
ncbi:unnamed protein product [Brassica oleracea var. botrytis]